jgi:S-adenosylmethionine:tRNA ribosyltransferase-isomerase
LFDGDHDKFKKLLYRLGETPLPKWVRKEVVADDAERYQTIYAKHEGAVAAPFAGLHFSRELMKRLEIKGINIAEITLHLGLGSFRTIDVEDLTKHKMDSEQVEVDEAAVRIVNDGKANKKNICAVGTTVFRALETNVTTLGTINPFKGWTNKFIFPPYDVAVPNSLITNFHLPYSTLLMLVSAFAGYDLIMDTYHKAIKESYRFGIYGDAMLILDN